MSIVAFDQNPTITDTVEFRLETPDDNGCLTTPYKVDKIVLYFVERDFVGNKLQEYTNTTHDLKKLQAALAAEAIACNNPTTDNINTARRKRLEAESDTKKTNFYFNEASPIATFGTPVYPAWFNRNAITGITATNPAVIEAPEHGLTTGNIVQISETNSVPDIDGQYTITVLSENSFSVLFNLSAGAAGTTGKWLRSNTITSVTAANPAVVTSASHGLSTGDHVVIYGSNTVPSMDGRYVVSVISDNEFYVNFDLYNGTPGTAGYWYLSDDADKNIIQPVVVNNQPLQGVFRFLWDATGAREGDYFICWTWTSVPAGQQKSSHFKFYLAGNTQVTTSIPTHFTKPDKYKTLLERYTPEMFKLYLADRDMTPSVMNRFNESVAMGFTTLENLANQIVDLQDANSIHEALLPYLSNYFNLKLKSNDPTRWRGQIIRAIPNFKAKGTKRGLAEAMQNAGITLVSLKQLWQVISNYTWQEVFRYDESTNAFELEKVLIEPLDTDNFELSVRKAGTIESISTQEPTTIYSENHRLTTGDVIEITGSDSKPNVDGKWTVTVLNSNEFQISVDLSVGATAGTTGSWLASEYSLLVPSGTYSDYVSFDTVDGKTTMTWDSLSFTLNPNDFIKVLYQYASVPGPTQQGYEEYLRTLPLIDTRDEADQSYPLKNWNVRGIAEDDVLFNVLIPSRHPYVEPLYYGKVRTEFPYSENIYNMEEYNGSIRNSKNPCDIDKDFMDPCKSCISSSYVVEVEVQELSDDRANEIQEVLREYTPFDAMLHTLNIAGGFQEFVTPPIEVVEANVTFMLEEPVIAGDGQQFFNRAMRFSNLNELPTSQCILRDQLASAVEVATGISGTAYNDDIVLYCSSQLLENIGIRQDGTSILQITDGVYAGTYSILGSSGGAIVFDSSSLVEPIQGDCTSPFNSAGEEISSCSLPFKIVNPVMDGALYNSLCDIERDNIVIFGDDSKNFSDLGVKTQFDVQQGTALAAYTISIPDYGGSYIIEDIDQNGRLILSYSSSLPTSNATGKSYTVLNGLATVTTGTQGFINVTARARVTALNTNVLPISSLIVSGGHYQVINSTDYLITGFVPGTDDQFYITGYTGPEYNGINLVVRKLLVSNKIGYLSYRGLKLQLSGNYESSLGIQNGSNPVAEPIQNNKFMENFIVDINGEYYWMTDINGNSPASNTTITLSGLTQYWKTSGTAVTVNIYRYDMTEEVTVIGQQWGQPSHTFINLNRSGGPVITGSITSDIKYILSNLQYIGNIPASGYFQVNESNTSILINDIDVNSVNQSAYISSLTAGGYICLLDENDQVVCNYLLNASPTDHTTYWQLSVTLYSGSQPASSAVYGLAYRATPIEDETLTSLSQNGNQMVENVKQNEAVSFRIEFADGSVEQGEL